MWCLTQQSGTPALPARGFSLDVNATLGFALEGSPNGRERQDETLFYGRSAFAARRGTIASHLD
ncbi:MAG TPA: hypothetical protein P5307_07790, partial [Pirellulaceae bacterium]|nr:hypothetical protein [Pirellulaceae bacterium]